MKKILLALTLFIAASYTAIAQDNYDTPFYQWMKQKAATGKEYTTIEVYRTDNPDKLDDFFITYNINTQGIIQSAIMFNQATISYEYNDDGKLVKDVFSIPRSATYINTYTYNTKGQLTEKRTEFKAPDTEPTLSETATYTYNADGKLDTAKISNGAKTAEPSTEISFTYNKDGFIKEAVTFKVIGKEVYKTFELYNYDKQGRVIRCEENNISGEMVDGQLTWNDDIGEKVTKTYTYTEDDKVIEKTEGRGDVYYMIYIFNK